MVRSFSLYIAQYLLIHQKNILSGSDYPMLFKSADQADYMLTSLKCLNLGQIMSDLSDYICHIRSTFYTLFTFFTLNTLGNLSNLNNLKPLINLFYFVNLFESIINPFYWIIIYIFWLPRLFTSKKCLFIFFVLFHSFVIMPAIIWLVNLKIVHFYYVSNFLTRPFFLNTKTTKWHQKSSLFSETGISHARCIIFFYFLSK